MWNKKIIHALFLSLCLFAFANCKTKKNIIKDVEAADFKAKMEASDAIRIVHSNDFTFNTLQAIIKTKYETSSGEDKSFKTHLKIIKDSAILADITYLNIPILSTLITKDSIILVNKRDKMYFVGSIKSVSEYFKVPVDYRNIENLLVGNAISLDSTVDHYLVKIEEETYLSSLKKSELPDILSGKKVYFGWMYRYWINELYRPGKTILNNPGAKSSLEIMQDDYIKVEEMTIPNHTNAVFKNEKDTITIKLNYNKVKINNELSLELSIPDKYTSY